MRRRLEDRLRLPQKGVSRGLSSESEWERVAHLCTVADRPIGVDASLLEPRPSPAPPAPAVDAQVDPLRPNVDLARAVEALDDGQHEGARVESGFGGRVE